MGVYAEIDNHPWLRVLRQSEEMAPWLPDVTRQLDTLVQQNVRYLILYKAQVGEDRVIHWRRYLAWQPVYEDAEIAVFATQPQVGRDFDLLAELEPGLGPVQSLVTGDCLQPGHVLEVDIAWGSVQPIKKDYQMYLSVVGEAGEVVQTEVFPLMADWPTSQWPAHTLAWGYYPFRLDEDLSTGHYRVTLALGEVNSALLSEPWTVGELMLRSEPCPASLPSGVIPVGAYFGEQMYLLGYEINEATGDFVTITLYWRAQQRMDVDYTVFVHVADPFTGVPVAQNDAMPHQGGYPTRFWAIGEVVVDRIQIDMTNALPGDYQVAIGVYDPTTGERLSVTTAQGEQPEDSRLVIEGEVIEH
jgi:hypothetical protein